MSRHAINPVIDLIRDGWDGGDNWGSALSALFDIAAVMTAAGVEVPAELEYRHSILDHRTIDDMAGDQEGMYYDTTFDEYVLANEYKSGAISDNDMRLAALTLNRYLTLCRAAGLDY